MATFSPALRGDLPERGGNSASPSIPWLPNFLVREYQPNGGIVAINLADGSGRLGEIGGCLAELMARARMATRSHKGSTALGSVRNAAQASVAQDRRVH
jgi:hypothetical protein